MKEYWLLPAAGTLVTSCLRNKGYFMMQEHKLIPAAGTLVTSWCMNTGYFLLMEHLLLPHAGTQVTSCFRNTWLLPDAGRLVTSCCKNTGYFLLQEHKLIPAAGTLVTSWCRNTGYFLLLEHWLLPSAGTMVTSCCRNTGYFLLQNTEISCYMNREVSRNVYLHASRRLDCLWDGAEVFLPFTFIRNYFDVFGAYSDTASQKEFEISSSNSRVVKTSGPYSPWGEFMQFVSFDVEGRARVLCVSATDGVPVSTQWDPEGYYYPTQIAQFALAHYSAWVKRDKHKQSLESRYTVQLESHDESASRVQDEETNSLVIQFKDTLEFYLESGQLVLSLDLKVDPEVGTGFKVLLQTQQPEEQFALSYTQSTSFIQAKDNMFIFGFGEKANNRWLRLTRDLFTDLKKGLAFVNDKKRSKRLKKSQLKVVSLIFYGSGKVANVSLSESEDLRMFVDGANWFLKSQDEEGGWPSNVVFNPDRKKYPKAEEILPGWYGAMCQGQAISVLCRAYHVTGDSKYLDAAEAALLPFTRRTAEGGVRTTFMEKYDWYEEYPTHPATLILNGFMYSLIGLYDLTQTNPGHEQARELYLKGMESLEAMLPFYDAGSATFYDLRHYTMKTSPKIARWDYHATHINQLLLLASIQNSSQLSETAERWRGYMVGKRAPHN